MGEILRAAVLVSMSQFDYVFPAKIGEYLLNTVYKYQKYPEKVDAHKTASIAI